MKRKFLALILAALCAATSSVCFAACNFGITPQDPPADSGEEKPEENEKPAPPALTFDNFIKDHKAAAVKFFEDFIYNGVAGKKEVKAENWYLNDKDGDNKVESAAMCYIYCVNETERAVEVANITFAPVAVQDIVDGKVTSFQINVSREAKLTFDAKEEEKQTQASTLLSETKLNGVLLKSTAYAHEEFEEEPPVPPDPPEETVTNAEIIAALNEKCIDGIVNATWLGGEKQDKQFITDGTWYLTKDNDGKVTKAEYAYTYQKSNTNAYYVITEVEFSSPLTVQNIKDWNFENSTFSNVHTSTNYKPSIQTENKALADAICDKAFGKNENATRYIIDGSGGTDAELKEVHYFIVIQIENGNVREASITIKDNSAGYVANVNNGKCKEPILGNHYELSGEKVIIEE